MSAQASWPTALTSSRTLFLYCKVQVHIIRQNPRSSYRRSQPFCHWPLWTKLQIRTGLLVQRILSNACCPADLSCLRGHLYGIRIVTAGLASRPRAATTAMLVPSNDLPGCDGGHAACIASFGAIDSGTFQLVFSDQEIWNKIGKTYPSLVPFVVV